MVVGALRLHCDTRWGHTPRQGTAARLRDLTFSARPISTAGVEGRVAAVLRVNLRAGTRPRSSAGTHGPAEVPGNAGGCHSGEGRRPLHLLRPSSLHLWRCAYPRNPPHTSPRHQDCTPGEPDHPTRTHDAAPPAQRTRATCLATLQRAPANFTQVRRAGGNVRARGRFWLRPHGRARHVHVAEAPAFRVPPRAPPAAWRATREGLAHPGRVNAVPHLARGAPPLRPLPSPSVAPSTVHQAATSTPP